MRLYRRTQHERNQQSGNSNGPSLETLRFPWRHVRTQKAARRPVVDDGPEVCLGRTFPGRPNLLPMLGLTRPTAAVQRCLQWTLETTAFAENVVMFGFVTVYS